MTRIEFQLPHLKKLQAQTKICIQTASFGIQRNFKLNKDSQTESFSQPRVVVSAVSNPKEPKTSTNCCILCAVREELTYICRVCLTKFILCFRQGSVYPLKFFILEMKVYPLFQAGKSLSSKVFYFRDESILCSCRQGSLSSVSGREEFIL